MKSSLRFWAVTLALTATAVALEAAPRVLAPPQVPVPSVQLRDFLSREGVKLVANETVRRRMPDWSGWRFEAGGCQATALPLSRGGDFDIDARREVGPGQALRFIYAGRSYARPPVLASNIGHIVNRIQAAFGLGTLGADFYVGLIEEPGCAAGRSVDWRGLWPSAGAQ